MQRCRLGRLFLLEIVQQLVVNIPAETYYTRQRAAYLISRLTQPLLYILCSFSEDSHFCYLYKTLSCKALMILVLAYISSTFAAFIQIKMYAKIFKTYFFPLTKYNSKDRFQFCFQTGVVKRFFIYIF